MNLKFITFNKQWSLPQNIAKHFNTELYQAQVTTFADSECVVTLPDYKEFTGQHAVIIHSTSTPVHDNFVHLLLLIHELKQAGAKKISGIIPYFGYSRHDKSKIPNARGPVEVIIKTLEHAGLNEIITVDIHEPKILKLFSVPVYNVPTQEVIAHHIEKTFPNYQQFCIVAPDAGAKSYANSIAHELNDLGTIIFKKERYATDKTRVTDYTSQCQQHNGILVDDIISTGSTAINACEILHATNFKQMYGYFVHPVLAGQAVQKIETSPFNTIFVSNTIDLPADKKSSKIGTFDVSPAVNKQLDTLWGHNFSGVQKFKVPIQRQV